jgi:hypothetical protein
MGEEAFWHSPTLVSFMGVLVALAALAFTLRSRRDDRIRLHELELAALRERCSLLESKMDVFWRAVAEQFSSYLKKPTHREMDDLLDKLKADTLTLPEAYQLKAWLSSVYLDEEATHIQQRIVAVLVMAALDHLIAKLEPPSK